MAKVQTFKRCNEKCSHLSLQLIQKAQINNMKQEYEHGVVINRHCLMIKGSFAHREQVQIITTRKYCCTSDSLFKQLKCI